MIRLTWLVATAALLIDEAHNLEDCLKPLLPIAREVIIVDTGSTDGTPDLAAALGATVDHWTGEQAGPYPADFAAARNRSFELATAEWILVIGADNRIAAGLDHLPELMAGQALAYQGPVLHRQDVIGEKLYYQPRLFRNRAGLVWQFPIYGILADDGSGLPLSCIPAPIVTRCVDSPGLGEKRFNRDLIITDHYLSRDPDNPAAWFLKVIRARALAGLGRLTEALATIQLSPSPPLHYFELWNTYASDVRYFMALSSSLASDHR